MILGRNSSAILYPTNVKCQSSNEAQNPNDQKNLIKFFNPLSALCDRNLGGHGLFNLSIDLLAGKTLELCAGRRTGSCAGPTAFTNRFIDLTDAFVFQISNGFVGTNL